MILGAAAAVIGAVLWGLGRTFPDFRLGRLPGDVVVERPGFSLYAPLTTMLLASLLITAAVWLIGVLKK